MFDIGQKLSNDIGQVHNNRQHKQVGRRVEEAVIEAAQIPHRVTEDIEHIKQSGDTEHCQEAAGPGSFPQGKREQNEYRIPA